MSDWYDSDSGPGPDSICFIPKDILYKNPNQNAKTILILKAAPEIQMNDGVATSEFSGPD